LLSFLSDFSMIKKRPPLTFLVLSLLFFFFIHYQLMFQRILPKCECKADDKIYIKV
jgi:hypothetical protein